MNVLFIMSDGNEMGCYGSQLAKTPHLDALAATEVRFDRAYCQYPLCNPSRSSMLTGRRSLTTGVIGNCTWFGAEHPDYVSLPRHFRQQGYVTLQSGKIFHGGIVDTLAWSEGGKQHIHGEGGEHVTGVVVRTDRWRYAEPVGRGAGAMLIDLENDSHEVTNLVEQPQHSTVVKQLSALARNYVADPTPKDEQTP